MNTSPSTGHMSEGDIVRLCDAEMTDEELVNTGAHLRVCDECRQSVERYRDEAATVAAWLGAASATPGPTQRAGGDRAPAAAVAPPVASRRFRRIAGGLVLGGVVAGALAADPIRSWVTDLIAPRAAAPPAPVAVPEPEAAVAPPPVSSVAVGFTPTSDSIVVRFRDAQTAGALRLEWNRPAGVLAEVVNGGDEALVLVPDGIQVLNVATSRTDYRVSLPPSVRVVMVYVADDPVARVSPPDSSRPVSVPLAPSVNPGEA